MRTALVLWSLSWWSYIATTVPTVVMGFSATPPTAVTMTASEKGVVSTTMTSKTRLAVATVPDDATTTTTTPSTTTTKADARDDTETCHTPPFSNIMAANRAEIAVRIMRAATELNCGTVAIYVHEDRFSQHRKLYFNMFLP